MAKAKKKLNTKFLVTAASVAAAVGVAGLGTGYFIYKARRPDQLKAEARKLMDEGNYEEAYKKFTRAGSRKATDPEFLTWMQETESRLTSFDPKLYPASYHLLGAIISASSDKFGPTLNKAKADIVDLDHAQIEQMSQDRLRDLESTAKTLLEREPNNGVAYRLRSYSVVAPLFAAGATPTSAEVQAIIDQLKPMMEAVPNEPDVIHRYVQAISKLRESQIRELSISDSTTSEQARALYREYRRIGDLYQAIGTNESLPAEDRARAYYRNMEMLQYMGQFGLVPREDLESYFGPALVNSATQAATIVPVTSAYYYDYRARLAGIHMLRKDPKSLAQAEKVMRETMEALPKHWQPRLMLANILSDQNRPVEAVELLNVDLKPSYDLVGVDGSQFYQDAEAVPLRRAYFRLQSLAMLKPEERDAEIKRIEEDYKAAISKSTIGGESNPYALQVQAGLQEIRQDRTGALQTLTQAMTKMSESPQYASLRLKVLEQLVRLNLSLSQTGRAEELAETLLKMQPDFQHILQVIDLKIRNRKMDEAKKMLDATKAQFPDQPALAVLGIRLLPDEDSKRRELDKIPEKGDTPEKTRALVEIKMKVASEAELEPVVGEIAERFLKDNPDDYRVSLMYVQSLLKLDKKPEALRRISALRAKDPTDANLQRAEDVIKADTPEKLREIYEREMTKDSPLNTKLLEAQKVLAAGDAEKYLSLMREAEAMDQTGSVSQNLFYYFMSNARLDDADAQLTALQKAGRDPAEIKTNRMRIRLARASIMQAEGKAAAAATEFDKAADEADKMVAEMPQFSGAWIVKGLTHNARGQLEDAYKAFQAALDAQPGNTEALHYGIELSLATNRGDDMKSLIQTAKSYTPNDPYLAEASLRYEIAFGDPSKAIEPRQKERDATPDKESTWLSLGQTYLEASKKATDDAAAADYRKKAIETFTQAKAKFPESPGFGLAAASVMHEAGDDAGAQKLVDELAANPKYTENPNFLAALADYYLQVKNNEKGLAVMQQLLGSGKASDPNRLRGSIAQIYAQVGEFEKALAATDGLPDTQESRELRVNLLLTARRFDDANKLANSLLEKEKSVNNLLMASHTEAQMNNIARSIDLASQAVALDPNNANAHLYKAKAMLREPQPRNTEIMEELETVKKIMPTNVEARYLAADRYAAMGKNDEAVSELESLAAAMPGNRDAAVRLIQAYLKQKPVPYGRIDSIFDDMRKNKRMDAGILSLETNIALQRGDVQRAVKAAKEAAETDLNNIGLYRQLIDVMIRAEQYKEVLADLDRIQAKNPNVYWTYMVRGIALHRQKKDTEAQKNWDKALNMVMALKDDSPTGEVVQKFAAEYGADATGQWLTSKMGNEPRMRALMINLYDKARNLPKVIELGETLIPLPDSFNQPTKIMVLNALGNAYLAATPSQPDKALTAFDQLVVLTPEDPLAVNNRAYAKLLVGIDLDGAVKDAKLAYDLSVKSGAPNAYIADTHGWALVRSGKVQEGIDVLREASTIEDIPDVAYHLGEAYLLENQKDAAIQSLQKALVLIDAVSKNGGSVDSGLEARVKDALTRATGM